MSDSGRTELVAQYRAGYGALLAALDGLTPDELDWRPSPEAWSVRDVVHHLEDAAHTHEHAAQIRQLRLARVGAAPPPAAPSGAHGARAAAR